MNISTANEINGIVDSIIASCNESSPIINIKPINSNKLPMPNLIIKKLGFSRINEINSNTCPINGITIKGCKTDSGLVKIFDRISASISNKKADSVTLHDK
jgi:hypothetical protein